MLSGQWNQICKSFFLLTIMTWTDTKNILIIYSLQVSSKQYSTTCIFSTTGKLGSREILIKRKKNQNLISNIPCCLQQNWESYANFTNPSTDFEMVNISSNPSANKEVNIFIDTNSINQHSSDTWDHVE